MSDRELLELAAKAAAEPYFEHAPEGGLYLSNGEHWSPLTDDGDALRLAVKCGISVLPYPIYNEDERHSVITQQRRKSDLLRENNPTKMIELYGDDPYAATRRAIVRTAAEIGRSME